MSFQVKRVREPVFPTDGKRYLVDGLWPRGMSKDRLAGATWLKEIAPSTGLRRWYNHEPKRWPEFQSRYAAELDSKTEIWQPLVAEAEHETVTLLCDARDVAHSNAAALASYLRRK